MGPDVVVVPKRKVNWAMVAELIEKFGAEFMVNMEDFNPMPPQRARLEQMKVINKLREMDGHLSAEDRAILLPHEYPEYPTQPDLVIVWDRGYPANHRARGIMSRALSGVGITRDRVAHVFAVPEILSSPPLPQQLAKYRMNVESAIAAANCRHVLLVGAGAVNMWRSDLKVSEIHGQPFAWKNRWIVFPIYNPIALVVDPTHIDAWRRDLHALCMSIQGERVEWMTNCYKCGEDAHVWDENAVGWCRDHFNINNVANKNKAWSRRAIQEEPKLL